MTRVKAVARTRRTAPSVKARRWQPNTVKLMTRLLVVVGVCGAAWAAWDQGIRQACPIRYVRVQGSLLALDEDELRGVVAPLVGGSYFQVNLTDVESAAKSLAWVESVRVVRQWPDAVLIEVRERRPVARWNEASLLSDRGVRFSPRHPEAWSDLPRLFGVDGQEARVLEVWSRLNAILKPREVRVSRIELNPRQSWLARLSDGKELVIGRQDPQASIERLLKLLPDLGRDQLATIKKVDLRYHNGFAVVWGLEREGESNPVKVNEPKPAGLNGVPNFNEKIPKVATIQW